MILSAVVRALPRSEPASGWCICLLDAPTGAIAVPADGSVEIGRHRDCALRVDDPLVSRRHARIHGGAAPVVEDLGSTNATLVVRRAALEPLAPGRRTALAVGDVLKIGDHLIGIHRAGSPIARLIPDLRAFAVRLAAARPPFGVIRIRIAPPVRDDLATAALFGLAASARDVACGVLDGHDLGLLIASPAAEVEREARRLAMALGELDLLGDVGHAVHPRDGATGGAVFAAAASEVATLQQWRLSAAPRMLAPPATRCLGREVELDELRRRFLHGARLITIVGPPGIGKSRLARRYAELCGPRPVAVCELAAAPPVDAIATALGSDSLARRADRPGSAPHEAEPHVRHRDLLGTELGAVVESLSRRRDLLVLLDDADRGTSVRELVERALAAAPGVRFLVTACEPLGVAGEQVIELDGLVVPAHEDDMAAPAVQLLVERAPRAEPRELVALARAVDGMPLALELAAHGLEVYAPAELVERLARGNEVLVDGERSVDGALERRWAALSERERAVLGACAARGVFTLDEVPGTEVAALRRASWLRAEPEHHGRRRFSMYACLRRFVAARAAARQRLVIQSRAHTLVLPSGARIDLARNPTLRRIVLALAVRHREGAALSTEQLLAAGWPGERVETFSGRARVRVALSRLRSLGMRDLLVRAEDGYVLAPDLVVEIQP